MPIFEIDESTPGEVHEVNLVANLTEEEHLEFGCIQFDNFSASL